MRKEAANDPVLQAQKEKSYEVAVPWYNIFDDSTTVKQVKEFEDEQAEIFKNLPKNDHFKKSCLDQMEEYEVESDEIEYASDDDCDELDKDLD